MELIRGLSPAVVHTAAAFTYTLLVLLAGLLAKGRATGREGVARVLIGSGIMLAPQLGNPVFVLLGVPDHVGTGVPLLLIFLVLDRAPRRWYVPPVIGLMLAWATVARPAGDRRRHPADRGRVRCPDLPGGGAGRPRRWPPCGSRCR